MSVEYYAVRIAESDYVNWYIDTNGQCFRKNKNTGRIIYLTPVYQKSCNRYFYKIQNNFCLITTLMRKAFKPKLEGDYVVKFIDGDITNHRLDNLEFKLRKQHKGHTRKVVLIDYTNKKTTVFKSIAGCAKYLGYTPKHINMCLLNHSNKLKRLSHINHKLMYYEDYLKLKEERNEKKK